MNPPLTPRSQTVAHVGPLPRGARGARGFTLIEVMAAIVFMAIVLPVAMRGFSLATSAGDLAKTKAEAAVLAHSKLNEIIVTRIWQNGAMGGDFSPDHPNYRWSAELKNWDASTLKELDVHVMWGTPGRERTITLSTLLETQN